MHRPCHLPLDLDLPLCCFLLLVFLHLLVLLSLPFGDRILVTTLCQLSDRLLLLANLQYLRLTEPRPKRLRQRLILHPQQGLS